MKHRQIYYAVLLTRKDGSSFYAIGDGAPKLFLNRKAAMRFRDELAEHGCSKGKIKKVSVEITEI